MFLPGSDHVKRRQQLGKTIKKETLKESRRFIEHIIDQFGQCDIVDLTPKIVVNYLFDARRSARMTNYYNRPDLLMAIKTLKPAVKKLSEN